MHKIGQSGGFIGEILGPILKTDLPLINVLKPLAKYHYRYQYHYHALDTIRVSSSSSNRFSYSIVNF